MRPKRTRPSRTELRARFAVLVERRLGLQPQAHELDAALGSVLLRAKQSSAKLSPVLKVSRPGRRAGIKEIAPFSSSTYGSFESCPSSCPFGIDATTGERRGCFVAANINQRRATNLLDRNARKISPEYRRELLGLAQLWVLATTYSSVPQDGHCGGRDIRLHVSGDVTTVYEVQCLAEGVVEWQIGGGGTAWTFTHSWRDIPHRYWNPISVLASTESGEDVLRAMDRGYAAAIVVPHFPAGRRSFRIPDAPGTKLIPCPHEVGVLSPRTGLPITCVECRICLRADRLLSKNCGVAFEAHGVDRGAVQVSLERVMQSARGHTPQGRTNP